MITKEKYHSMYYKLTPIQELPKEDGWYPQLADGSHFDSLANCVDRVWVEKHHAATHYLSPVPAIGAVWVKASERLPFHLGHWNFPGSLKDINFPVRLKNQGKWYYSMGEIYDEGGEEGHKWSIYFDGKHHFENEFSEIEWRGNDDDETASPCDRIDELEKEVERLKELIAEAWTEGGKSELEGYFFDQGWSNSGGKLFTEFEREHNL